MKSRTKGFTFIEMILVAGVIALVSTFLLSSFNPFAQIKKSRDSRRKRDLDRMRTALENYYDDHRCYPVSFISGSSFTPYLDQIPVDPSNIVPQIYYYSIDFDNPCPDWYKIYSRLEYTADKAIAQKGCSGGCGPGGNFNYWVSSSNVYQPTQLPGEDWPWPPS